MKRRSFFEDRFLKSTKLHVFDKYFSLIKQPDNRPVSRVLAFQKEALQEIVNRAYDQTIFYKEKMDLLGVKPEKCRSLQSLTKLPFTTKKDLLTRPGDFLADKRNATFMQVSIQNTDSDIFYLLSTWRDQYLHEFSPVYQNLLQVEKGEVVVNALPYEMDHAGLMMHKFLSEGYEASVIPAGQNDSPEAISKTLKVMKELAPRVLVTTPEWAIKLAKAAYEEKVGLQVIKKIYLVTNECSEEYRVKVKKFWRRIPLFMSCVSELGLIGMECLKRDGLHIAMGHVILEIIDKETNESLPPGKRGKVVLTSTTRYDTPLIRYMTELEGFISLERCECGVQLPRLFLEPILQNLSD